MFQNSLDFLNIFVVSPGNTFFFLVVMLLIITGIGMSTGQRTLAAATRTQYLRALAGVFVAFSVLAAGALFSLYTDQSAVMILPPLEPAVMAVSVLLIGRAFVPADDRNPRRMTISLLVLLLIMIAGYIVTGVQWAEQSADTAFNRTLYATGWAAFLAGLSLVGAIWMLAQARRIQDAPLKFVFFIVLMVGYGATAYLTSQGDLTGNYSGVSRLTFVMALLLVPVLLYRRIQAGFRQRLQAADVSGSSNQSDTNAESARSSTHTVDMQSVQLLKSLGMILEDATPERIPAKIVQTSLDVLRADLGALLRINDANYADIEEAYDRIMERHPAGISLNLSDQPTLMTAYEYRRQRSLFPDKRPGELDDLYTRFDVEQRGPAYFQPLTHNGEVIAVLLIAYPYTQRELRPDQIELLKGLAIIASNLLSLSYEAQEARNLAEELTVQAMVDGVPLRQVQQSDVLAARQEMQTSLRVAREQISNLTQQVTNLETELDSERQRLMNLLGNTEQDLSLSQRIRVITDEQEQLRDERNRLMKRVQEAEAALNGAVTPSDDELAHQVLQQVQREKETLEAERNRLQAQLDDLRAQDKTMMPQEMQKLVNRMVQEKTRLEQERNQLSQRLKTIQANLREAGMQDDTEGIIQLIQRLYSERVQLLAENEQLQREHDRLLQQNQIRLSDDEQSARIETLEQDVEHLAADREAALKQRHQWRNEIDDLRDQLNAVKEHRARLMAQVAAFEMERQDIYDDQQELQAHLHELADEKSNLMDERDRLRATLQAVTTERNQLLAGIEGDPARLKQVNAEGVGALRQMVNELSAERDRLTGELHDVRRQLVELEQQQDMATLTAISNGNGATYQPDQPELLVGLVQELRTPMTSISGYLELLLNESAGILGEKQRKFMHRVAANIQRLDSMINSLVKITELDTGAYRLKPRPVDVVHLVEEAITNAALQFREKGLAVNLNIDDSLPTLPADEDAVRQIVGQLLTNAYLASPADTAITVTVARRNMRLQPDAEPRNCLYLAIEDRGGGIMPEDIPRVFARKYRAENPLIDGLGDTGVGMSIAQTLVEAHEGHLWVESKMGQGTVFSFAIPLNISLAVEND